MGRPQNCNGDNAFNLWGQLSDKEIRFYKRQVDTVPYMLGSFGGMVCRMHAGFDTLKHSSNCTMHMHALCCVRQCHRTGEILMGAINHSRVGYFTGAIKNHSRACGVPQELFCMANMRYFRGTGMIFPKVSFTLDVI
jgi:hypothetical protein